MPVKFLVVIGVFIAAMVSILLDRAFGGAGFVGIGVGCVAAAVVLVLIARNGNGPEAALVFGLLAVAAFAAAVVGQFRSLGWATALAIDVPVLAVIVLAVWYTAFGRHRLAAQRLCRRTAQAAGWRYRKPDADLLRRVRLAFPAVRNRLRTLHAAVDGVVDGVAVTFVTGRTVPQTWLIRLPFALPSAKADRAGGVESDGGQAYRGALLTPAVADATGAGTATQWRIERDDLVVVFGPSAAPEALQRDAAQVARLAHALPLTDLRRYEINLATVPDPAEWTVRATNRRSNLRVSAGLAIALAVVLLVCGLTNVGTPSHRAASVVMLCVSSGLILFGVLTLFTVPRTTAAKGRPARPTGGSRPA